MDNEKDDNFMPDDVLKYKSEEGIENGGILI